MENLPQHQRELEKVDFIGDIIQYITKFDNKSMILRIPYHEYHKFKIDINQALKLCETVCYIDEAQKVVGQELVVISYVEIEFNWRLDVRKYLWYKFGLGKPSLNWD